MQPAINSKPIDYDYYLNRANPQLPKTTRAQHLALLEKRLAEIAHTPFETKMRFSKEDPFSFVKLGERIGVLLSGKVYPTHFPSKVFKFNFAFIYGKTLPLLVSNRETLDMTKPPCNNDMINILTNVKKHVREIVTLYEKFTYISETHKLKRGLLFEHFKHGDLFDFFLNAYYNRGKKIPWETSKDWITSLLCAFKELHARNILHRDIKLENIFLTEIHKKLYLRIADFEFARIIRPDKSITLCNGTVAYLAPEILYNEFGLPNDVWTLGIVLYTLFYSKAPPFVHYLSLNSEKKIVGIEEYKKAVIDFHQDKPTSKGTSPLSQERFTFRWIIWRMLDPNPDTRLKLSEN